MPVGTSDIAQFGTVGAELQLTGTPLSISSIYAISNTAGAASSGSFHNLVMGTTNQYFSQTIYPLAQTPIANQSLAEWQGYDHDASLKLSVNVFDQTGSGVVADIILYADTTFGTTSNTAFAHFFDSGVANPESFPDHDTSIPAYTTFFTGSSIGYYINMLVNVINPGIAQYLQITANDDDNVGAGTARETYTDILGNFDLAANGFVFDSNVLGACAVGQVFNTTEIPWNKRTRINIDFLP